VWVVPIATRFRTLAGDSIRPAVIKLNRQFVTNALFFKRLVPGKGTSEDILASELYGKLGQQAGASNSILVSSAINALFHETVAERGHTRKFVVGHGRIRIAEEPTEAGPGDNNTFYQRKYWWARTLRSKDRSYISIAARRLTHLSRDRFRPVLIAIPPPSLKRKLQYVPSAKRHAQPRKRQ